MLFNKPASLKHYKTGTKLYTAQITDMGKVFARSEMEVRTTAEQVLAYYMAHAGQFTNQDEDGGSVHTTIGERCNDHSAIAQYMISMPSPLQDRQLTVQLLWEKLDDSTYFIAQKTCVHQQFPKVEGAVSMSATRLIKLTKTSESSAKVEVVGSMNLCGSFPAQVNNIVTISRIVRTPITLATFFTAIRAADAFDEEDAKQLGQLLFRELRPHRHNAHVLREKVGEMICLMNVLSAAQAKYRFIDEFLFPIIRNEMKKGAAQTGFSVSTPLVALSADEAGRIGRSLVMLLMSNATGEAAVDEHIRMFPALGGLDREFNWFRDGRHCHGAHEQSRVRSEGQGRSRSRALDGRHGVRYHRDPRLQEDRQHALRQPADGRDQLESRVPAHDYVCADGGLEEGQGKGAPRRGLSHRDVYEARIGRVEGRERRRAASGGGGGSSRGVGH